MGWIKISDAASGTSFFESFVTFTCSLGDSFKLFAVLDDSIISPSAQPFPIRTMQTTDLPLLPFNTTFWPDLKPEEIPKVQVLVDSSVDGGDAAGEFMIVYTSFLLMFGVALAISSSAAFSFTTECDAGTSPPRMNESEEVRR